MSTGEEKKPVDKPTEESDKLKGEKEETFPKPEAPAPKSKSQADIMKEQEAKLRNKYPSLGGISRRPGAGGSALLHKRLSKGTKYFDSGDYNMAKSKKAPLPSGGDLVITDADKFDAMGEEIATPDNVPERKLSLCQPTTHSHHFDAMIIPKLS